MRQRRAAGAARNADRVPTAVPGPTDGQSRMHRGESRQDGTAGIQPNRGIPESAKRGVPQRSGRGKGRGGTRPFGIRHRLGSEVASGGQPLLVLLQTVEPVFEQIKAVPGAGRLLERVKCKSYASKRLRRDIYHSPPLTDSKVICALSRWAPLSPCATARGSVFGVRETSLYGRNNRSEEGIIVPNEVLF